jgi:hypothetical protein
MPYALGSFLEWLRWQTAGPERAAVGTPPARLTVLMASGRKALTPKKRGRVVRATGRLSHQEQADDRSK